VGSLSNKLIEVAVIVSILVVFLAAMQLAYGESICDNQTSQTTGYNQSARTQENLDKFNLDTDVDIELGDF
jgi:hypothetical protein